MDTPASGPLAGLRVVEFSSIGPGPHCAMLLSDLGAQILRIDREGGNGWPNPIVDRGRATEVVDIRAPEGQAFCLDAIAHADVLIEGFRPGVMERLGLGPETCLEGNPRLVYGRMTGWGQDGPLSRAAGHDINYIAVSGALAAMGRKGEPAAVPLNLVGDFGGGSMFLAFGILAALWERERSGKGQIVDAAIIDGVTSLMSFFAGLNSIGLASLDRENNLLGGSKPFYRSYLCRDGREISVGPLEPKFFAELISKLGLSEFEMAQYDADRSADLSAALEAKFASADQSHWTSLFEGGDACVFPVIPLDEVAQHPHMAARMSYIEHDGRIQAAPAPRFSRTPGQIQEATDARAMLAEWISRDGRR